MTEAEFDIRMDETEESWQYWQSELVRLQELRDNRAKIEAGLDYVTELMSTLQEVLPTIDQTPEELKALPILLRHSPGMMLRNATYVISTDAARRLRQEGVEFTELGREAAAPGPEGVGSGERI